MAATLRLATPEDAPAFAAIYAPFVRDGYASFEVEPPTVETMKVQIERILETHPWLALDGRGYAYASPHRARAGYRWAVDVAIYLAEDQRGTGQARGLYEALFEILRAQGYVVAYAGIALPNAASVGLHEAMGFRQVALYEGVGFKAGAWRDVGWWALDLAPRAVSPEEPIPFSAWRAQNPLTLNEKRR